MSFKKILFATDFSDSSNQALDAAVDLAKAFGASLTIVHVCELPAYSYPNGMMYVPTPELVADIHRDTDRQLEVIQKRAAERGLQADTFRLDGEPRHEIPRHAHDRGYDLIVVGSHGRRGVKRLFLGSVAEHVVREAQMPVLTVHSRPAPLAGVVGAA